MPFAPGWPAQTRESSGRARFQSIRKVAAHFRLQTPINGTYLTRRRGASKSRLIVSTPKTP